MYELSEYQKLINSILYLQDLMKTEIDMVNSGQTSNTASIFSRKEEVLRYMIQNKHLIESVLSNHKGVDIGVSEDYLAFIKNVITEFIVSMEDNCRTIAKKLYVTDIAVSAIRKVACSVEDKLARYGAHGADINFNSKVNSNVLKFNTMI